MTAIYDSAPTLRTDEFADKIFDAVRGAALVQAMYLGDRLGWYQALADEGPLTAAELAHSTGTVERYAREWLEQQSVSGVVTADVSQQPARFGLPREYAAVLVDADSDSYMAPMARFFTATGLRLARTCARVPQRWRCFVGAIRRRCARGAERYQPSTLPESAHVTDTAPDTRCASTAAERRRVADVGCGEGWSAIGLAQGHSNCEVDGYDIDEASIAAARRNAAAHGVADRVTFTDSDGGTVQDVRYDVVFAFECIHDLPEPSKVLSTMRRIAKPGAPVIVMDERTADAFDPDAGPVEELLYGYSILCCLPDGMSHDNSAATGTVMRASTLDDYARAAGFDGADPLPIEHDFFRFYRLQ